MARIKFLQEDFAGFRPDREVKKFADPNKLDPLQTIQAIRQGVQATKEIAGAGMDVADFLVRTGVIGKQKTTQDLMEEAAKKRAAEATKAREGQREGVVAGQEKLKGQVEAEGQVLPQQPEYDQIQQRKGKRQAFQANVDFFKSGESRPEYFIRQVDSAEKEGTITPDEAKAFRQTATEQLARRQEREKFLQQKLGGFGEGEQAVLTEEEQLAKLDEQSVALAKAEGREIDPDTLARIQARAEMVKEAQAKKQLAETTQLQKLAGTRPLEEQLRIEQKFDLMTQGKEGQAEAEAAKEPVVSKLPPVEEEKVAVALDRLSADQAKEAFEKLDAIPPDRRNAYQQYIYDKVAEKYKDQDWVKSKVSDEFATINKAYGDYVAKADERKKAIQASQQLSIEQKQKAIADIDAKIAQAKATTEQMTQEKAGQQTLATQIQSKQEELNQADLAERNAKFELDRINADPTAEPALRNSAQLAFDTATADKVAKQAELTALQTGVKPAQPTAEPAKQAPLQRAVDAVNALKGVKSPETGKELPLEEQKKALEAELSKVQDRVKELETNEDTKNAAIKEAGAGIIASAAELAALNYKRDDGKKLTPDELERMVQLKNYISQNKELVEKLKGAEATDPKTKELVVALQKMVSGGKAPPPETQAERNARFDKELKQFDAETAAEIKKAAEAGAKEIKGTYLDADQAKLLAVGAVLTNDRKMAQAVLSAMLSGKVVGMKPNSLTDWLSGDYKDRYNNEMFNILFHLQKGKSPEELAMMQQQLNLKTFGMLGALEERFSRMEEREQKMGIREEEKPEKQRKLTAEADKAEADAKKAVFQASDDVLEVERRIKKAKELKEFIGIGYLDELSEARIKSLMAQANYNNGRLGLEREKMKSANATEAKNSLEKVLADVGKSADNDVETQQKELKAVKFYGKYFNPDGSKTTDYTKDFPDTTNKDAVKQARTRLGLSPEAYDKLRTGIVEYETKVGAKQTTTSGDREIGVSATQKVNKGIQDLRLKFAKLDRGQKADPKTGKKDFMTEADNTSVKAIQLNKLLVEVRTRTGIFAPDANGRNTPAQVKSVEDRVKDIMGDKIPAVEE